jgi:hypothetical protein
MRFLSLLAIASIAFCVSMCTPNPANNVTPAITSMGNCRDGIQNGDEQGVDCGTSGCAYNCNGNMTVTAATVTYSSGQVTNSSSNATATCYTTNPITFNNTATRYSTTLTTYFYKNGTASFAYYMSLQIHHGVSPTVGIYTYTNSATYCLGGVINQFSIAGAGYPSICTPASGTGTLNITSVNTTTRKMSGNFSATLQCTGNYPISGTFTDVGY